MTDGWTCPLPLRDHDRITMGHGGGGQLTAELIEHLFLPSFGPAAAAASGADAAVLELGGGRLAFTSDSHVVRPLFFPGGCIGDLAVNGSVNDLAMVGAVPVALSTSFIIEEGLELSTLGRVATAMGAAAARAGVALVTGDTKVVERGFADGLYISVSGVGTVADGVDIDPRRTRPGDRILVSGPIGDHGVAVLSRREGLEFGTGVESDTAPLTGPVQLLLDAGIEVRALRDPTRGGVAGALCDIAAASGAGIACDEAAMPVREEVVSACAILGLDPMHVANEGRFVAVVAADDADDALAVLENTPLTRRAAIVGEATDRHAGRVVARTVLGAERLVERPLGEQLPRIC